MSIIYLNIEPNLRSIVENFDNAVTAWKALMKHFRPDNRSDKWHAFPNFCHVECQVMKTSIFLLQDYLELQMN